MFHCFVNYNSYGKKAKGWSNYFIKVKIKPSDKNTPSRVAGLATRKKEGCFKGSEIY